MISRTASFFVQIFGGDLLIFLRCIQTIVYIVFIKETIQVYSFLA
jgi:hypothetical protein